MEVRDRRTDRQRVRSRTVCLLWTSEPSLWSILQSRDIGISSHTFNGNLFYPTEAYDPVPKMSGWTCRNVLLLVLLIIVVIHGFRSLKHSDGCVICHNGPLINTAEHNWGTKKEQSYRTDSRIFAVKDGPRSRGLALQLDDGTRKSHSIAENTAFVTGFFRGLSNRKSFASLVCSLYYVYSTMEKALDDCQDKRVRSLDFKELRRIKALERDMQYFYGPQWRSITSPSPATVEYCKFIEKTAKSKPYLLIAHQYTRYLGDLFGGQLMGGMASKSLQLQDGAGIAFYQFQGIPDSRAFIDGWYLRLNNLSLSFQEKEDLVDEANTVFQLNIALLEELEGNGIATAAKFAFKEATDSALKLITSVFQR